MEEWKQTSSIINVTMVTGRRELSELFSVYFLPHSVEHFWFSPFTYFRENQIYYNYAYCTNTCTLISQTRVKQMNN